MYYPGFSLFVAYLSKIRLVDNPTSPSLTPVLVSHLATQQNN